jgi:hypothetical protein
MSDTDVRPKTRLYRLLAILLGLVAGCIATYYYISLQMAGFPDGHLTDLDTVQVSYYPILLGLHIASGAGFIYISFATPNNKIRKYFLLNLYVYLVICGFSAAIDYYFSLILDDGVGG